MVVGQGQKPPEARGEVGELTRSLFVPVAWGWWACARWWRWLELARSRWLLDEPPLDVFASAMSRSTMRSAPFAAFANALVVVVLLSTPTSCGTSPSPAASFPVQDEQWSATCLHHMERVRVEEPLFARAKVGRTTTGQIYLLIPFDECGSKVEARVGRLLSAEPFDSGWRHFAESRGSGSDYWARSQGRWFGSIDVAVIDRRFDVEAAADILKRTIDDCLTAAVPTPTAPERMREVSRPAPSTPASRFLVPTGAI
jgi:hypothetical protein